ncbi:HNH endonuclease [Photobacterium makurazakiensis]|uniref:HNH endonuclease n=1 Tax=Photobacterium makurazakiensis TaxID=2910234 RepID=UPI003D0B52A6
MQLDKTVYPNLEVSHLERLQWASDHSEEIVPWSELNRKDFMIAMIPKGIYKPAKSEYALSVKQIINGPYADRTPVDHSDGTWTYYYYQEGHEPSDRDKHATNRGLLKCMEDKVPVAVVIQQTKKPQKVTYLVKGIGLISEWKNGYFKIDGFSAQGKVNPTNTDGQYHSEIEYIEDETEGYEPNSTEDGREKTFQSICKRRGQKRFRNSLIRAYGGACAITGTNVESVLEAAHITPYNGEESNHISNGILLRADIHTLWDLGLIAVDESEYAVLIKESLKGTIYEELFSKRITLPKDVSEWPSVKCFSHHRKEFGL